MADALRKLAIASKAKGTEKGPQAAFQCRVVTPEAHLNCHSDRDTQSSQAPGELCETIFLPIGIALQKFRGRPSRYS